ncbi:MAG TPA: WhiB family transcriptional regulator [Actinocrinis sp.]|nr:WhiB family transcriptional regulator [Actinocrinis sp.]
MSLVQAPALIRPSAPADEALPVAGTRPATRAARPRKAPVPYPHPDDDWQERGACRSANPSLFFAPDHESNHQRRFRETAAKAICAHCPVRAICRAYALQTGELYGIWGGTTERERTRTNAHHRQPAADAVRK